VSTLEFAIPIALLFRIDLTVRQRSGVSGLCAKRTARVDIKRALRITAVDSQLGESRGSRTLVSGPFLALSRTRLEASNRSIRAPSSEQIS
jgi:hypothetical protein